MPYLLTCNRMKAEMIVNYFKTSFNKLNASKIFLFNKYTILNLITIYAFQTLYVNILIIFIIV